MTESVWDYPRPPRVEQTSSHVRVVHDGVVVADSTRSLRVLETSHPPGYYIPREDVVAVRFEPSAARATICEWKGAATYLDVVTPGGRVERAAWTYTEPRAGFEEIRDAVAFYAQAVDECCVDEERVNPQDGSFYGGWITSDVVGPFKGAPRTTGW
jgi:uncharacterized protein (DUF427 family)